MLNALLPNEGAVNIPAVFCCISNIFTFMIKNKDMSDKRNCSQNGLFPVTVILILKYRNIFNRYKGGVL